MTAVLDLHDSTLRLWHGDALVESPGYAWFDGKEFRFGVPAMRTQRRTPREVNTRYWSQLNTQPLSPPLGQARHAADLVHAHLKDMHQQAGQPETLLVTAPGTMDRDALSLLLGIVEHLPFTLSGLVHRSAVLAAASGLNRGLHVEMQLHQTEITYFELKKGIVTLQQHQTLPANGMIALQDLIADAVAKCFVSQTRFDPLSTAEAEQTLYDSIPSILEDLHSKNKCQVSVGHHTARLTLDDLNDAGSSYSAMLQPMLPADVPVLMEIPPDLLPGVNLANTVHTVYSAGFISTLIKHLNQLLQESDSLVLQEKLVCLDSSPEMFVVHNNLKDPAQLDQKKNEHKQTPTHILEGHIAKPLSDSTALSYGHRLDCEGDQYTLILGEDKAPLINGQRARNNQTIRAGDTLEYSSGIIARLIRVE